MNNDKDHRTVDSMLKSGGGFVKKLAELAQLADAHNLQVIKSAWPEYWAKYERMSNRSDKADNQP